MSRDCAALRFCTGRSPSKAAVRARLFFRLIRIPHFVFLIRRDSAPIVRPVCREAIGENV